MDHTVAGRVYRVFTHSLGQYPETQKLYLQFWTQFKEFLQKRGSPIQIRTPSRDSWMTFPVGRTGFAIAAWNTMSTGQSALNLAITGPHAREHFALLSEHRTQIEQQLGTLEWRNRPQAKEQQIGIVRPGKSFDPTTWPEINAWMADRIERWTAVFRPIIKSLDASNAIPSPDIV